MSYIRLDNTGLGNTSAGKTDNTKERFNQALAETETKPSSSPFNRKAETPPPLLLADASNFDFRKLGLNGERLGYPEQAKKLPQGKNNNSSSSPKKQGKTQLKPGSMLRGVGWIGAALLLNEAIHKLVGPAPILKTQLALGNDNDLAITVYGKEYKGDEAEPGTAFFTRGFGGEKLDVPVTVTEDGITFDPEILQQQYGKALPENLQVHAAETTATDQQDNNKPPELKPGFAVETRTQEEKDLVNDMLAQGKSSAEINTALTSMRNGGGQPTASFKPWPRNFEYSTTVKTSPRSGGEAMVFVMPKNGKHDHDGVLSGIYNERTGDLNIGFYSSSLDGKNIGTELISSAIETVGPSKVRTVSGSLLFENSIHDKLLATHGKTNLSVYRKNLAQGMNMEEAMWNTPLGKSMSKLGFNDLTITSPKNLDFRFGFK